MKLTKTLVVFFCVVQAIFLNAQFDTFTIDHDGLTRTYYKYVSANYNSDNPASVVVWLHGMGDISVAEVQNQYPAHQFIPIADTANFIILVPVSENYALLNMRAWNSQAGIFGISPNTNVDDFGFIDAMLDETIAANAVNEDRLFICGFSMGAFMTQRFALQHNSRFAAYASVGGTIGGNITSTTPNKPIRLAHFHGTEDGTVGYENNTFGMGAEQMRDFWLENNNCDFTPVYESQYTDTDPSTNTSLTVDYYVFSNGEADIEFHKQNGAGHIWPKNTSTEIWKFFSKHEGVLRIDDQELTADLIAVYPNPTQGDITIEYPFNENYQLDVVDAQGRFVYSKACTDSNVNISLGTLNKGMYFVKITNSTSSIAKKVMLK